MVSFNLFESVNDDRNPKYPNANALIDALVVTRTFSLNAEISLLFSLEHTKKKERKISKKRGKIEKRE